MRIAIVTGASSGLGREYVERICRTEPEIEAIWAIARRKALLEQLQRDSALPIVILAEDLTDRSALQRIEARLSQERPDVRLLINAAGYGRIGESSTLGAEDQLRMIDLNCAAAVALTLMSLPYMRSGARILEICSVAAFQPLQMLASYAASKAFLYRYTRALRVELLLRGIRVTAVCPYWIRDTEFISTAQRTERGGREIRRFPLASRASSVARISLRDSRLGLAVSTPGIVPTLQRIGTKLIPSELIMGLWALIRRV